MDRLIDDWIKERIDGTDPESMIYVAAERDPFEQYDIAMKWATFCEDEGRIDDKELGVLWMAADALKDLPTLLNESAQLSAYHSTGLTPEQVAEIQAENAAYKGWARGLNPYQVGLIISGSESARAELATMTADRDAWKRRAEAAELEIDQAKNKVFDLFEKSNQIIDDQSDFVEELQKRLSTAEKVCSAAYMYIKHINSPLCVGWDMLLDALRKWTDERRPRDEGKEGSL